MPKGQHLTKELQSKGGKASALTRTPERMKEVSLVGVEKRRQQMWKASKFDELKEKFNQGLMKRSKQEIEEIISNIFN